MPIPGPGPVAYAVEVLPTGSPFWLSVNGVWLQVEGIIPSAAIAPERPRSSITSVDGRRFEQRAPLARRSWTWTLPFAARAHLGAVVAAVESEKTVWLMSDPVAIGNMLPPASCFGTELPAIDCGGVPLPSFTTAAQARGWVRGGVPTTLSFWADSASGGDPTVALFYPGLSIPASVMPVAAPGQQSYTFTPAQDGELLVAVLPSSVALSGLMLTEGDPEPTWVPGESMPCPVVVDDPADVLLGAFSGAWRHDYSVTLREVF